MTDFEGIDALEHRSAVTRKADPRCATRIGLESEISHCGLTADHSGRHRTPPYPWCIGNPATADCVAAGRCRRSPGCGD